MISFSLKVSLNMTQKYHSPSELMRYFVVPFEVIMIQFLKSNPDFNIQKDPEDILLELIGRKGLEHEAAVYKNLSSNLNHVVEIEHDEKEIMISQTLRAMEGAADLIYQGSITDNIFFGKPDFLMKTKGSSRFGNYQYEILDAKLAKQIKPEYLIQLCCYSELLESTQGVRTDVAKICLGDNVNKDINTSEILKRQYQSLFNNSAVEQSAGDLFKRPEKSFHKLSDALINAIKKYYLLHQNEDNEFIRSFPKDIKFSSAWFVKMESGGHLTSHIHEEGWISGAVYLAIPKDNGTDGQEGAIELSSDGDGYPRLHDEFEKKVILPKVGDVIFFPSSVFHRTIPFNSNEERICIAFDVKPKLR